MGPFYLYDRRAILHMQADRDGREVARECPSVSAFASKRDQLWFRDGVKRTGSGRKSKIGSAAGSLHVSAFTLSVSGGQDRVARWRWP